MQFLYLASELKDCILIFDQSSSCNCVECRTLKSLQFFHFIATFLMSFTKIPVLLQYLFMKKLKCCGLDIHDIKEVESVRQQEEQEDKRDEETGDEMKGEVEVVRRDAQHTHET